MHEVSDNSQDSSNESSARMMQSKLIQSRNPIYQKIDKLSSTLKDTSHNLKSIDKLVGTYRDVNMRQMTVLEKLHDDLSRRSEAPSPYISQGSLGMAARRSVTPNRLFHATSDDFIILPREAMTGSLGSQNLHNRSSGNVRFHSPPPQMVSSGNGGPQGNGHERGSDLHDLHRSLRDLASEQKQFREEMQRLSTLSKERSTPQPVGGSFSQDANLAQSSLSLLPLTTPAELTVIAAQVDRRLQVTQETLKAERLEMDEKLRSLGSPEGSSSNERKGKSKSGKVTENGLLSSELLKALNELRDRDTGKHGTDSKTFDGMGRFVMGASKPNSSDEGSQSSDFILRSKLNHAENQRKAAESNLEEVKRKSLQDESTRLMLHRQLEECHERLSISEREKSHMKAHLDSLDSKLSKAITKLEEYETREKHFHNMEQEMIHLKDKLHASVSMKDLEDLRRTKDKLERNVDQQREQLIRNEHESMEKDRQIQRLLGESRTLQDQCDSLERAKEDLTSRLRSLEQNIREARTDERLSLERAQRAEQNLEDAVNQREAQLQSISMSLKQLQDQVQTMEGEKDALRDSLTRQTRLTEMAIAERDEMKRRFAELMEQADGLRKELENLLAVRSKQEEMLRRKIEEGETQLRMVEELQSRIHMMEKYAEKAKYTIEAVQKDLAIEREEKARLEERLSSSELTGKRTDDQCLTLKSHLQQALMEKDETLQKLHEEQSTLKDCRHEIETLRATLKQSQRVHRELTSNHEDLLQQNSHTEEQWKREVGQLTQALEKSETAMKILSSRCERQAAEIGRLHDEHWRADQENIRLRKKETKLRQLLQKKTVDSENEVLKSRHQAEIECTELQDTLADVKEQRDKVLRWALQDIDGLVELVATCIFQRENPGTQFHQRLPADIDASTTTMGSLVHHSNDSSNSHNHHRNVGEMYQSVDVNRWLMEVKSKLSWLRGEIQRLALSNGVAGKQNNVTTPSVVSDIQRRVPFENKTEDNGLQNDGTTISQKKLKKPEDVDLRTELLRKSLDNMEGDNEEDLEGLKLEQMAIQENQKILDRYESLKTTLDKLRKDIRSAKVSDGATKDYHNSSQSNLHHY